MSEHLLTFADMITAQTERPDLFWTDDLSGETFLRSSMGIETRAITDHGVEAVYDHDGMQIVTPATPPSFAPGYWVLLLSATEAEAIVLPEGVLALETVYASPMPAPVPQP